MRSTWAIVLTCATIVSSFLVQSGSAQQKGKAKQATKSATPQDTGADWPMYHRDFAGTGYSPLAQITAQNVHSLTPAWTYRLQSEAPPAAAAKGKGKGPGGANSDATPIVVNGVMDLSCSVCYVTLESATGHV